MKAVLLARVSSAKQVDGFSLDAQISRLRDYCASRGLEIIKEFVFEESSTRGDRKQFNAAIKFCREQRQTVALVADSVDRIQRSFKEWQMLEKLRLNKTLELHFLREAMIISDNTPPFMLTMWEMMITVASSHVKNLAANVKRGMNQKVSEGEWGAKAPPGYLNQRDNGARRAKIVVDESKAPIIKRLFEYYATGQYNLNEMTKFAQDWGLKNTWSGELVAKQTVVNILSNPFYYGEMKWNGQLLPHVYPPLVSREIWDACDRHRRGLGKQHHKYGKIPFMYRGMIKCARTGKSVCTERKKGKYNYLGYWDADNNLCFIREEEITEQIARILDTLKLPDEYIDDMAKSLKHTKDAEQEFHKSELVRMRADLDRVDHRRSGLVDLLMDHQIDKDIYDEKLMELNRIRAEIMAKMKAYEETDYQFHDKLVTLYVTAQGYADEWRRYMGKLAEMPESCDKGSRIDAGRTFLKAVIRTMEIKDGTLGFSLHTPFNVLQKSTSETDWLGQLDSNQYQRSQSPEFYH